MFEGYRGEGRRIEDVDLPRIGALIGVGEDPLHALLEVEPHKFFAHLKGPQRAPAVSQGLAYPRWGEKPYPKDSYPRLLKALAINETAALMSASWGLPQMMGENFAEAGFASVQDMIVAFADDEDAQLQAMVAFIKANHIDDDLRRIDKMAKRGQVPTAADWVPVVRVYNGPGYARNDYHNRAARAFAKWMHIKDTSFAPTNLKAAAAREDLLNTPSEADQEVLNPQPMSNVSAMMPSAAESQQIVSTPTVVVEQETAPPRVQSQLDGIKSHVAAAIAFLTTTGSALVGWIQGASKTLILAFFIAGALVGIVYIVMRFWRANQAEKNQIEREKMAHELTILKMKSAMDQTSNTVELAK